MDSAEPVAVTDAPRQAPTADQANVTRRVLVVDDEPGSRFLCEEVLRGDYAVTAVSSGQEALAAMQAERFDVLVTDLQMAEMNGFILIETVAMQHPKLPVVVISAYLTPDMEARLHTAKQPCEILRKPLSVQGLRDVVACAIANSNSGNGASG
jgi:DNA-binding NtrC family response regulator